MTRQWISLLAFAAVSGAASAQNIDLGSLSRLGDVLLQPNQAFLTTASLAFQDDGPAAAGAFNASGFAAASVGAPPDLELFAGLAPGALDPDPLGGIAAFEGSAVSFYFLANAGDRVSFAWKLLTNEGSKADYAFVLLNGSFMRLAVAADATNASGFFATETAPMVFDQVVSVTGAQRLVVGVVDVEDFDATTAIVLSDLQVSPVPEPGPALQLMAGLALIGALARRRFL
jgi:hypothetical protein